MVEYILGYLMFLSVMFVIRQWILVDAIKERVMSEYFMETVRVPKAPFKIR